VLEQGMVGDYKMQSLFAAIRMFGGGLAFAYAGQAVLALVAAAVLAWVCRTAPEPAATGAALAASALLVSPFLLVYDLVLLAIPLLWIWRSARTTGFLPWEKSIAIVAFAMPLISSAAAFWLHIPLAPLATIAVFVSVVRRISWSPTVSR
jgi:alpha-1,2-mannosyltransferase